MVNKKNASLFPLDNSSWASRFGAIGFIPDAAFSQIVNRIMKFSDWVLGSSSPESTFKDLMDSMKNGVASGLAALAMQSALSIPKQWVTTYVSAFLVIGFVGAIFAVFLSLLQTLVVLDRMSLPGKRWLRWFLVIPILCVYVAAGMLGSVADSKLKCNKAREIKGIEGCAKGIQP